MRAGLDFALMKADWLWLLRLWGLVLLALHVKPAAAQKAFPGAEGAGADTRGGRGGQVLFVTNLNNAGPGSFREAVETHGPRTVIFHVSGIIDLSSSLTIDKPYLTVAGQTAPGDGICFRGNQITIRTHDVILRHLRFRPGDIGGAVPQDWPGDALALEGARNVIVDHCSFSWAVDECVQIYAGGPDDEDTTHITFQWNIISEPLRDSTHAEGPHGANLLIRTDGGDVSIHHNLLAHGDTRNPRVGSDTDDPTHRTRLDFRNNIIYNWGDVNGAGGGRREWADINYIGNWVQTGPSTTDDVDIIFKSGVGANHPTSDNYRIYQVDNVLDGLDIGWNAFVDRYTQLTMPVEMPITITQAPGEARDLVLAEAGATLPRRDPIDERIINNVVAGTGEIIDSQDEAGGWPIYGAIAPPPDSDLDGMPDHWETENQLNAADPSDSTEDADGDGYTNLEEFLNGTDPQRDEHNDTGVGRKTWMNY